MTTSEAQETRTDRQATQPLSEMQKLAQRVERHHTAPLPEAQAPERSPFPAGMIVALWLGIVGGGVLGLFVGVLLQNQVLVIPGAEGLYSMTPFTFQFFWLVAGVALGIVGAAVATLLIPRPEYWQDADHPEYVDVDGSRPGNVLEIDLDDD